MAQHRQSPKEHTENSSSDPRQHNTTSTGRGESGSARDETVSGSRQASTSSGRRSNESDARDRTAQTSERETRNEGLTMGTNGGERIGAPERKEQRQVAKPASHPQRHRKAS
jgi:hypothetical protein